MGQATGFDGNVCLASCEASSTPLYYEGPLGDAVNFFLSMNYTDEESDDRMTNYLAAQAKVHVIK